VITHIRGAHVARRRGRGGAARVIDVAAIGVSSGGPRVLDAILSQLPADLSIGLLVVQHMAEGFMPGLIEWLRQRCPLDVRVAADGDAIEPGRVLFAPDGAHLVALPSGRIRLSDAEAVSGHRPSVDVAFGSLATVYGARAAGIVLTGMGVDGAAGLLAIRQAGGVTMVQDEASCVVFGMPRAAIELGGAERVLPPAGIVDALKNLDRERRRSLRE
jgi:two-component system chemotaxis response regulator CheB